jgi:hypothetical protein
MLKERRKDHCAIRCEKIEYDMTDQDKETDSIEAPDLAALRYLCKKPTGKKCIKGDQNEGMSNIPMILKIGLMLEETEDKITVREETHGQT